MGLAWNYDVEFSFLHFGSFNAVNDKIMPRSRSRTRGKKSGSPQNGSFVASVSRFWQVLHLSGSYLDTINHYLFLS